jgi:glycosyltransferase involved in cell wall biosynthesis
MRILCWHVHGAWSTAFVQGGHTYLVPTTPDRGPYGLGRARTYPWPDSAVEVAPAALAHEPVDVAVLQRPEEWELAKRWLGGRRPGRDVPVVYVEHNTPKQGPVPDTRHPMADRDGVTLVHVTHFNRLFWDAGATPTRVIEHGIPDPGVRWTGELPRIAVAINEPVRRGRVTGTDLLPAFAAVAPLDVYGMKVAGLPARLGLGADRLTPHEDLPQARLHAELVRRRLYLHPHRWTSLGLSLLEAMTCGVPVVVLASTEAVMAVPPAAGALSTNLADLVDAARWLLRDADAARRCGAAARTAAVARYGLDRFLSEWDAILKEVTP